MQRERTPARAGRAARRLLLTAALTLGVASGVSAQTENWPQWRGPDFTAAAEAEGLPAEFGPEQHVIWSADLPGSGAATPLIWGDRIFLNSVDRETNEIMALCLDADTGREVWRHTHGPNARMGRNDRTAPSPVTDGEVVVYLFGSGRMVAYDFEGEELWRRELIEELGEFTWLFGYGASPLLHDGVVYMQLMRRPQRPRGPELDEPVDSYLLAINPATGEDIWRHTRPTDAVAESTESYITPMPFGEGEDAQIVLTGGDAMTGHCVANQGEELWRYEFNLERRRRNWRLVPSTVTDGERIFAAMPRGTSLVAVEPGGERGNIRERALWVMEDDAPDVCTPLLYRGRLYVLDGDRRTLTSLNPVTGERYWSGSLGEGTVVRASPTAGDGKIYVMDERGRLFVAGTGDEFELLAVMELGGGEPARSSIPIVKNRLYVRTASQLLCVGTR